MPLEAIEKISELETKNRERKAAAEAEARQIIADAEQEGLALLQNVRKEAAERGKQLLTEAEARAAERAAEIAQSAKQDGDALRAAADKHLEEAAEFIVGRVVNT